MDFSKVDWWHVAGITAITAVAAPVILPALGVSAVVAGVGGVLGLLPSAGAIALGAGAVSAVGQAKASK